MAYRFNPHPKDMVVIRGTFHFTTPDVYIVPAGKIFVLTALGTYFFTLSGRQPTTLYVNGVPEITAGYFGSTSFSSGDAVGPWCSVVEVPECITFPAGSILRPQSQPDTFPSNAHGRAWGYLAKV